MQECVRTYILSHHLLSEGEQVIVACSGGADSVALLHLLRAMGYPCIVAHCNFHLRGEESMRDEQFVRSLAQHMGVQARFTDFDTETYSREHGVSIEMAARDLRYAWFETLRQETGAAAIAVAHHQNDQAETLLLNLKRGTGLRGLGGMRPKNGYIIRPLLCLNRQEIEAYCQQNGLSYVTDSTNTDTRIRRNAIRAILQDCTPQEIAHFSETAELLSRYDRLLSALLGQQSLDEETEQPLLFDLLRPYGFNASQVEDIRRSLSESQRRFEAPSFVATIDHGVLRIAKNGNENENGNKPNGRALFDLDRLPPHLTLRHWQPGDYFYPYSRTRAVRRKVQDFFSDLHLSREEKEAAWILADGETIVWVVGYRTDDRFKVTESTLHPLEITFD